MKQILVICGPTASGKTALAVECAKRLNGEVVSADSMLIYRRCNIGSAKPTLKEMDGVKHYMIDIVAPTASFSVSDYEKLALPILSDISARGKTPIICGGTGFYIKALLFCSGFGQTPKDDNIRKKYEDIAEQKGREYLHSLLKEVDPESAEKLHYNDVKRVIRALEIFDLTGKKKSAQNDNETERFKYSAYQIDYERSALYERINARVDNMIKNGLFDEVKNLISIGVTDKDQCMQGIGYKEVYSGILRGAPECEVANEIKQNTRNYAKRQITFFKKLKNLENIPPLDIKRAAEIVIDDYERKTTD